MAQPANRELPDWGGHSGLYFKLHPARPGRCGIGRHDLPGPEALSAAERCCRASRTVGIGTIRTRSSMAACIPGRGRTARTVPEVVRTINPVRAAVLKESGRALQAPNVGGEALHRLTEVEDHRRKGFDIAHRDAHAVATSKRSDSTSGVAGYLARCLGHSPNATCVVVALCSTDRVSALHNPPYMDAMKERGLRPL